MNILKYLYYQPLMRLTLMNRIYLRHILINVFESDYDEYIE
jgi:hypothetical protein